MTIKLFNYPITRRYPTDWKFLCYKNPKKGPYIMFDKQGQIVGRMAANKEFINHNDIYNPDKIDYYSLYIQRLYVPKEHRGKGIASAFLNIAKADSYRRGCNGNVHLIAESFEQGAKPPQKIYRRAGFDSQKKGHIEIIDKAIAEGTPLPPGKWSTPMYFAGKD